MVKAHDMWLADNKWLFCGSKITQKYNKTNSFEKFKIACIQTYTNYTISQNTVYLNNLEIEVCGAPADTANIEF